jgi:hypothetical protein
VSDSSENGEQSELDKRIDDAVRNSDLADRIKNSVAPGTENSAQDLSNIATNAAAPVDYLKRAMDMINSGAFDANGREFMFLQTSHGMSDAARRMMDDLHAQDPNRVGLPQLVDWLDELSAADIAPEMKGRVMAILTEAFAAGAGKPKIVDNMIVPETGSKILYLVEDGPQTGTPDKVQGQILAGNKDVIETNFMRIEQTVTPDAIFARGHDNAEQAEIKRLLDEMKGALDEARETVKTGTPPAAFENYDRAAHDVAAKATALVAEYTRAPERAREISENLSLMAEEIREHRLEDEIGEAIEWQHRDNPQIGLLVQDNLRTIAPPAPSALFSLKNTEPEPYTPDPERLVMLSQRFAAEAPQPSQDLEPDPQALVVAYAPETPPARYTPPPINRAPAPEEPGDAEKLESQADISADNALGHVIAGPAPEMQMLSAASGPLVFEQNVLDESICFAWDRAQEGAAFWGKNYSHDIPPPQYDFDQSLSPEVLAARQQVAAFCEDIHAALPGTINPAMSPAMQSLVQAKIDDPGGGVFHDSFVALYRQGGLTPALIGEIQHFTAAPTTPAAEITRAPQPVEMVAQADIDDATDRFFQNLVNTNGDALFKDMCDTIPNAERVDLSAMSPELGALCAIVGMKEQATTPTQMNAVKSLFCDTLQDISNSDYFGKAMREWSDMKDKLAAENAPEATFQPVVAPAQKQAAAAINGPAMAPANPFEIKPPSDTPQGDYT